MEFIKKFTRNSPNPPDCFRKKLNNLCNVCGQWTSFKTLTPFSESDKTKYLNHFNREVFADGIFSPKNICGYCRVNMGKDTFFKSPMIWDNHKTINEVNHNADNCYCCQVKSTGIKAENFRYIQYPYHVTTITPPHPLPTVSKINKFGGKTKIQTAEQLPPVETADEQLMETDNEMTDPIPATNNEVAHILDNYLDNLPENGLNEDTISELAEKCSEISESYSDVNPVAEFVGALSKKRDLPPILITEDMFADWGKRFKLSGRNLKSFGQDLRKLNLLAPNFKITKFLQGHTDFRQFFTEKTIEENKKFTYCNDIPALMNAMGVSENDDSWRLYIDSCRIPRQSSKVSSLKVFLLHNGNKEPPVPLAYSFDLEEKYEHLAEIINSINYEEHQWSVCADLKLTSILVGRCGGNPKFPCHRCKWEYGRDLETVYDLSEKDLSELTRTSYEPKENGHPTGIDNYSIVREALIPANKFHPPPLHLKLGFFQILHKNLNSEAKEYIKQMFPKKTADVFTGPEISKICHNTEFVSVLNRTEKRAFLAFKNVSTYVLSSAQHSTLTKEEIVDEFFEAYKIMGCNFTYKMHLLRSHLDLFPDNIDTISDQHGEKLHQDMKPKEEHFAGQPVINMLARYCYEEAEKVKRNQFSATVQTQNIQREQSAVRWSSRTSTVINFFL